MSDRKRELLPELQKLVEGLVSLETKIAKAEVHDSTMLMREIKSGLLRHAQECIIFKKVFEKIRVEIVADKRKVTGRPVKDEADIEEEEQQGEENHLSDIE